MDEKKLKDIRANIFPAAWGIIPKDIDSFSWHNYHGNIDTDKPHSSQALCISAFGTLAQSIHRNRIIESLATELGITGHNKWSIELEYQNKDNYLKEHRKTQIDAAAISDDKKAMILFECKFTEPFGSCSQTRKISKGGHKGIIPCNGNYELQTNPQNGVKDMCALTGKGIKYWDIIPEIFNIEKGTSKSPCPFAKKRFQLMRNLTLANILNKESNVKTAVIVLYPDHERAQTKKWIKSDYKCFHDTFKQNTVPFHHWTYSEFIGKIKKAAPSDEIWNRLEKWINEKIQGIPLNKW